MTMKEITLPAHDLPAALARLWISHHSSRTLGWSTVLTMPTKRKHKDGESPTEIPKKEARKDNDLPRNEYEGFSLQRSASEWEIPVEDCSISAHDFFEKYISQRRPCIINGLPKVASGKPPSISLEILKKVAGDRVIQVERRFTSTEAFGQNRTALRQQLMTVSDFLKKLEGKDGNLYYLSTQDTESDDAFQVPCRQLLDNSYISDQVPWAGNLVLHSCNLVRCLTLVILFL